jgi:hypothetical protein
MLLPRTRPRRRVLGAGTAARLALALALTHANAHAQGTDALGPYAPESAPDSQSEQSWAFELRLGAYPPAIDEEFDGSRAPYREVFGSRSPFLIGVEFDAQLLRIPSFGSLGPAVGWGYATLSEPAPLHGGSGPSAQETSFSVMPMYAVAVLRIDVAARELRVPVVPYLKAGLGYALWWVGDGDDTAVERGVAGRGRSYGAQYAFGAMLLLDAFDQRAAREMDNTCGVNNSYVFAERYVSYLDGFGAGDQMHVGTATWMFGLALEL